MYYLWSADLSKSFSQLIVSIFSKFCPVEKCGVTSCFLYRDSLTLRTDGAVSKIGLKTLEKSF